MSEIVEINGKKYKRRIHEVADVDPFLRDLISIAVIYGGVRMPRKRITPANLVREYGLIERKESKLSASQRRTIVNSFNYIYEESTK